MIGLTLTIIILLFTFNVANAENATVKAIKKTVLRNGRLIIGCKNIARKSSTKLQIK